MHRDNKIQGLYLIDGLCYIFVPPSSVDQANFASLTVLVKMKAKVNICNVFVEFFNML